MGRRVPFRDNQFADETTRRLLPQHRRTDEDDRIVRIDNVLCLKQTEKAILCEIDGEEKWIPQSCVHANSEVYKDGDEGVLVVTRWFAEKAGLV